MMRVIAGALIVLLLVTVPAGATDPYEPVPGAYDGLTKQEIKELEAEREAARLIDQQVSRGRQQVMVMEATYYCYGHITATGTKPVPGRTVAADPTVLAYGTKLIIDGVPGYVVEDCGGDIKGARIDIFVADYATAIQNGRRQVMVEVME